MYRFMMQVLYLGRYRQRYRLVTDLLGVNDERILELCFGDTIIAAHCADTDRRWQGLDINENFVRHATANGFNASVVDLDTLESFPDADVVVISGSLYHFHDRIQQLLEKIFTAAPRAIISEPISNYSQAPGPIGWMARRGANPGTSEQEFRYNEETLLEAVEQAGRAVGYRYFVRGRGKDMILELRNE